MRLIFWLEKFFYVAIAFAITFYFLTLFKVWGQEQQGYFLFIGDTENAALVIAITLVATVVLERLLKWEIRKLFGVKKAVRK